MLAYLDADQGATEILGLSIAVFIVILVVVVVALAFLVRWAVGRSCPRCGKRVGRGKLDCPHCGFDFRTIGADHTQP